MKHPKLDPMKYQLDASLLRQLLDYDPETGIFVWKRSLERPPNWNGRYAGKQAGYLHKVNKRWIIAVKSGGKKRRYQAAWLAWLWMTGEWPENEVDHKNTASYDDRWDNLRQATSSQNKYNCSVNNATGWKGVEFDKRTGRYKASAGPYGTRRHIGVFNTIEEAHAAYVAKATAIAGEFARTA